MSTAGGSIGLKKLRPAPPSLVANHDEAIWREYAGSLVRNGFTLNRRRHWFTSPRLRGEREVVHLAWRYGGRSRAAIQASAR
ncbi:hypothetical protein SAMN05444321_6791 [Bradyrhizobium lablabi]|nr:hypothetical protein SAMN05444321_6791 [Bradyrhizobium lablabi]